MKLGASNKFFYYTQHDTATFNIRFRYELAQEVNLDNLKQAVKEALEYYPEFSQRVILNDKNRLEACQNTDEVCFYQDNDKNYTLGSKDTNGYLMFFRYGPKLIEMSYYHGLSDTSGAQEFVRCILYFYFLKEGEIFSEEETEAVTKSIRNSSKEFEEGDKDDLLAPYEKYANESSSFSWNYNDPRAFAIPANSYPLEYDYVNVAEFELSLSQFLKKTKEYGVSVVPLLTDIISGSMRRTYNVTDEPIVAMVPVSLRPYFESNTKINFSDGIQIPFEQEDEGLSHSERCIRMKEKMKSQMVKENFEAIITSKVKSVEGFENSGVPFKELAGQNVQKRAPAGAKRPISYALTYPGKIDLTEGLNRLVKDFRLRVYVRAYSVIAYTYNDALRIYLTSRTDDETYFDAVQNGFEEFGFDVSKRKVGYVHADQVKTDLL